MEAATLTMTTAGMGPEAPAAAGAAGMWREALAGRARARDPALTARWREVRRSSSSSSWVVVVLVVIRPKPNPNPNANLK